MRRPSGGEFRQGSITVSIAYAPSKTAKIGASDAASACRSMSTAQSVLVQNDSPTGNWVLRKYSRAAVGKYVHGCPGIKSPITTQLWARTVVARFGLRAPDS
jgi:hypothetical protein